MNDKDIRANTSNQCVMGAEAGPQTIIVRQVIGEKEKQKVLDIHVVVPPEKPAIEQIVDVFVKDVKVRNVEVITDKVIVRGEFDLKAIYVACLPDQPVHAVEIKHYRWTQDVDLPGARKGMDADASVVVEFVDYDVDEKSRAYKYKYGHDDCDDECDVQCEANHVEEICEEDVPAQYLPDHCMREFDVSVVLKITAKVMADREVTLGAGGALPTQPKG